MKPDDEPASRWLLLVWLILATAVVIAPIVLALSDQIPGAANHPTRINRPIEP